MDTVTVTRLARDERAAFEDVGGRSVVLHYGDVAGEYAALRTSAMLVDRSHRNRMVLGGAKAAELITGLVTNDVAMLTPGLGQYAAALTAKGKIVADVRIFVLEHELLVDVPTRAWAGWSEMVRKYINPRVAPYRDVSESMGDLGVFGALARKMVSSVSGVPAAVLGALPPFAHTTVTIDDESVTIASVPDLAIEGFELFAAPERLRTLRDRLVCQGAVPAGLAAWEIARVEAGRPEWGLDIDDTTIPQEANFDELHAISYTKGCYIGQETVARVHFRGHVNRHLRALRFASSAMPASRAQLFDDTGKLLGETRTVALSPRLGPIALGMVRREVQAGTPLTARWSDGECAASLGALPFPL